MLTDSIRWRLQLWLGVLLLGLLAAFGVTSWQLEKTQRIRRLDDELAKRATALGVGIRGGEQPFSPGKLSPPPGFGRGGPGGRGGPPDFGRRGGGLDEGRRGPPPPDFRPGFPPGEPPDLPEDRLSQSVKDLFPADGADGYYYTLWTGVLGRQQKSANAPDFVPMPPSDGRNTQIQFRDRDGFREAYHFTELGECVLAGRPLRSDLAGMKPFATRLILTGLGVLLVGLGGGWLLTTHSIRPIRQISDAASRISEGNLSERIPVGKPGNELGQLAGVLNSTFSKLEDSFAQQKRFTADASHELRTPLTVLITETQATLSRERSSGEYRETLEGNLETARQMKSLTEALLELARLDAGGEDLHGMPYDLAEVAGKVLGKLRPLAEARDATITAKLEPAVTHGSPERLGLVISNLVGNAIHHGRQHGQITLEVRDAGGEIALIVSDDGPGISPDDLPHLFERFYRADKSRTGSNGRYGLGLAICNGLVEAEGGAISVESEPGSGAVFTVKLPRGGDSAVCP